MDFYITVRSTESNISERFQGAASDWKTTKSAEDSGIFYVYNRLAVGEVCALSLEGEEHCASRGSLYLCACGGGRLSWRMLAPSPSEDAGVKMFCGSAGYLIPCRMRVRGGNL